MGYYQHHLFFCTHQRANGNVCCANSNAKAVFEYAKNQVKKLQINGPGMCRVNIAGCMDRCDKGPVMVVYPEGVWYTFANTADVDEIIEEHILNGRVVERLLIED